MLQAYFARCGCQTHSVPVPPAEAEGREGRTALLAHRRTSGKPRLLVYGHIDVVPSQGWSAYAPRREHGVVFGRGASDMKGGIAALLGALYEMRNQDAAFDLTAMVTMDEETSQLSQLRYLTPWLDLGDHPHVLSLDAGFGYVTVAILGLLQMDISIAGKSVHSALSHIGTNAIEEAAPLMQALLRLKRQVTQRHSVVAAHPATGLSLMEARLNINQIHGGIARNVVPDACTLTVDRRLLPEETVAAARDEILTALQRVRGPSWHVSREFFIPSVPPTTDPLAHKLEQVIQSIVGSSGSYGDMLSGELPYAARTCWGADAFATGVIRPENRIHGVDEFVLESDLDQLAVVLARFFTGGP